MVRVCESEQRNAITGVAVCCARATSGHATNAPPTSTMNSRRFTRSNSICSSDQGSDATYALARISQGSLRCGIPEPHMSLVGQGRRFDHARRLQHHLGKQTLWRSVGRALECHLRTRAVRRRWLFDHLVRPYQQDRRDFEIERSGCPQVDHQIKAGRQHDR
jgi:hypothetical protein